MNSDLINQVISNTRNLKSMQNQRRSTIVRKYGEEHDSRFAGDTATFYLPVDTDMEYISELKIKLVLGDINFASSMAGGTSMSIPIGSVTYKKMSDWLKAIPLGSFVDTDGWFGAQCWDYANAFWRAQTGRTLQTGPNRSASDVWRNSRSVNAGNEFTLITAKKDIKKGDWIVTSESATAIGHIALAAENYNGGDTLACYGQNQGGTPVPSGGAVVSYTTLNITPFVGAFRYKHWTVD